MIVGYNGFTCRLNVYVRLSAYIYYLWWSENSGKSSDINGQRPIHSILLIGHFAQLILVWNYNYSLSEKMLDHFSIECDHYHHQLVIIIHHLVCGYIFHCRDLFCPSLSRFLTLFVYFFQLFCSFFWFSLFCLSLSSSFAFRSLPLSRVSQYFGS